MLREIFTGGEGRRWVQTCAHSERDKLEHRALEDVRRGDEVMATKRRRLLAATVALCSASGLWDGPVEYWPGGEGWLQE